MQILLTEQDFATIFIYAIYKLIIRTQSRLHESNSNHIVYKSVKKHIYINSIQFREKNNSLVGFLI